MSTTIVGDPIFLISFLSYLALLLTFCPSSHCETDTLLQGQELKDGYHLDSAFGVFRLGFFTAPDSHRYIGIWYNIPEHQPGRGYSYYYYSGGGGEDRQWPVWVGNVNTPIFNRTGVLTVATDGNLKIVDGRGDEIAALTSVAVEGVRLGKVSAVLLDSGNFVLWELNPDGSVKRELWQSFDHPTDTLLPGMKLGSNFRSGHVWSLKPWRGSTDSNFTLGLDQNGAARNQMVMLWGDRVFWRSGMWLNQSFPSYYHFRYVINEKEEERYLVYSVSAGEEGDDAVTFSRITITSSGSLVSGTAPTLVDCYPISEDETAGCVAEDDTPVCRSGFYYGDDQDWEGEAYSLPENPVMLTQRRHSNCSTNCTCLAYGSKNPDGSGCQIGRKRKYSLDQPMGGTNWQLWLILAGVSPPIVWLILLVSLYRCWKRENPSATIASLISTSKRQLRETYESLLLLLREENFIPWLARTTTANVEKEILLHELGMDEAAVSSLSSDGSGSEFQFFSLEHILAATDNFHPGNKLGQGGFGPVYKGKLPSGLEVAIKRLSASSKQGLVEFKNEVGLIAKLQHDNLVRLVGCCIEKEEKILIYEYLPNKSLDFSLFAPTDQNALNWEKRFDIIQGIAQGLLYLHKYSRLKIIHRDLKASNILLDSEMNPKISDFGLAKIFQPNESRAITARVAGTFGYMSPEYAMEGVFSTKSDVFSFGVLLLEIVSGKRNSHFHNDEGPSSLVIWAWQLWREGRGLELVDPAMEMDSSRTKWQEEAVKCIHIGLLCVQENPKDRPSMLEVTSMIYNESARLPRPNRPAFYYRMNSHETEIIEEQKHENWTVNEVTITDMEAR